MLSLIGKKIGMSQLFLENGEILPVTAIEVEPNLIMEIKTPDKHNYSAIVVGIGDIPQRLLTKPVLGQFTKRNLPIRRKIIELRDVDFKDPKVGDFLLLKDSFFIGDLVDIQGYTRGHGYTGAIKLWNFACGPKSHGAGYPHRYQGSLETGRGGMAPQKVWKGKKMAGRYGNEKVTIPNIEVVYIDEEKNLLFVKGAIPGRKNRLVRISTTTRHKKKKTTPVKVLKYAKN